MRPAPVYTTSTSRPWARLDADAFRAALLASPLCQRDTWSALDVDDLAQLYDDTVTAALDDILPPRTVRCQRRPSDPWFDAECRHAKRRVRRFERAVGGARSVNLSGLRKCARKNRVRVSCGGLLMTSWVVDPLRPVRPLMPLIFTDLLTTKSPLCVRRRTGHRHHSTQLHRQTARYTTHSADH